ncbi:hypothetical protein LPA44_13735 [Halobacterium sp. KA-4]|uniref:hypothetical protein n=1 Tax=Halobacterium sp. KA-4 TaxID=2896367 RepID=UPI001E60A327|nr:hypothetical protein [Halobacterium sp. KA-4]MCD2200946.1 hypothetical protein [Halobacterium sp. KA-4]
MNHTVNFVAVLADSITEEFEKPPEELSEQELEDAAEEYFDSLTEPELRSLYRDGPISIDDAFEEEVDSPSTTGE